MKESNDGDFENFRIFNVTSIQTSRVRPMISQKQGDIFRQMLSECLPNRGPLATRSGFSKGARLTKLPYLTFLSIPAIKTSANKDQMVGDIQA